MKVALALLLVLLVGLGVQTWRANHWSGEAVALRREKSAWADERTALQAAISTRDAAARQTAQAEAQRLSTLDRLTAGDVSSAYQKGLAAGRAIADVLQTAPDTDRAPVAGGLRDYRALWAQGAYRPGD